MSSKAVYKIRQALYVTISVLFPLFTSAPAACNLKMPSSFANRGDNIFANLTIVPVPASKRKVYLKIFHHSHPLRPRPTNVFLKHTYFPAASADKMSTKKQ